MSVDWPSLLGSAVGGHGLRPVYQPIVDLARGVVVGYEALIRFVDYPVANPEHWFAAAREHGLGAELQAAALRTALTNRDALPGNCFLTVNIGPEVLAHPAVRDAWRNEGDLRGLIVELTEHVAIDDYAALEPDLDRLRAAGALVAVDDAGSGYAGLTHLLALRPAMIKLDRALVRDIDQDEAKRALVEMVGMHRQRRPVRRRGTHPARKPVPAAPPTVRSRRPIQSTENLAANLHRLGHHEAVRALDEGHSGPPEALAGRRSPRHHRIGREPRRGLWRSRVRRGAWPDRRSV